MSSTLSLIIFAAYFTLLLIVARFTSRGATAATFFNANGSSPWYLVAFGTIGASISGVTFVSVPGEVGVNHWYYLQFVLGNFVGYAVIAFVLIPLYYKLRLISIYKYLEQRFGPTSHRVGAMFFLLSQMMGASFRLFLVVGVLQILVFDALGVPLQATAALSLLLIWLYIRRAGIKTVVWTDTLQTICMIVAVVATAWAIGEQMDMNVSELVRAVGSHSSLDIFCTDVRSAAFFPKQFISGLGIVIVMNGLDQNIMQKSLTCRSSADAKKNMLWFSVAFLIVNILFVALGTLLYIFAENIGAALPPRTDDLFPMLVSQYLPTSVGIIFLLGIIAASFSSADSSLTALTTVWCIDIKKLDPDAPSTTSRRKLTTIIMAALMFGIICLFHALNDRSIVSAIFTVAGYTYGPLLGLFAFGIGTRRTTCERAVPYICVASPIISYLINWAVPLLFDGYQMGFELLIVNGLLTFSGLLVFSHKNNNK